MFLGQNLIIYCSKISTADLQQITESTSKRKNKLGRCGGHFTIIFFLQKWKFVGNVLSTHPQCILPHTGILNEQHSNTAMLTVNLIAKNLQK